MRRLAWMMTTLLLAAACSSSGGGGGEVACSFCEGGTAGGPGSGISCGGISGVACPADEYCYFGPSHCAADDSTGVCLARPTSCQSEFQPEVCGCDGIRYTSACEAREAGTDVDVTDLCPPISKFSCGDLLCTRGLEYCESTTGGAQPATTSFACRALPSGCDGSCSCLGEVPCGSSCTMQAGGSTVQCFAP